MLVIRRLMRRDRNREASMIATVLAGGEGLALHHRHLVPVLMDAVMHNFVDSGLGTEIARFELVHKCYARAGRNEVWAAGESSATLRRGGVANSNSSDPAKHNPAMEKNTGV